MTQSLDINGKQYQPSTVLAKESNYTSDYISKLARDEKILGTRVGRQWFIEAESLRTYIQQLEVEKRINKEALSQQRKREQQQHVAASPQQQLLLAAPNRCLLAAGQAMVVVICGLLVGTLFWSAEQSNLKTVDILDGGEFVVAKIMAAVEVPDLEYEAKRVSGVALSVASTLSTGSSVLEEGAGPQPQVTGQYTDFPKVAGEPVASTSTSSIVSEPKPSVVNLPFADEVVVREKDGAVQVRPVFSDSVGDWYELSAVRVNEEAQ